MINVPLLESILQVRRSPVLALQLSRNSRDLRDRERRGKDLTKVRRGNLSYDLGVKKHF